MGDHMIVKKTTSSTVEKPRMELEELYLGIPDESVNLTFQDLANLSVSENRLETINEPINHEVVPRDHRSPNSPLSKMPSLDFSTGLQATTNHHHDGHGGGDTLLWGHCGNYAGYKSPQYKASENKTNNNNNNSGYSMGYDDISAISTASGRGSGRRRRPGIPHSKICTICSTYTYVFRTRCLVCGRVYCRRCLEMGMGEMIEGRKCIECLGLTFSQRYIEKAGKLGCCSWRCPSTVKQAELKWAEKGPRRSGDKGYNGHRSGMVMPSRSRSPMSVTSSRNHHHHHHLPTNEPSFVMSSSFSPYSTPQHHHFPL